MSWHYLPIYTIHAHSNGAAERVYSIIEVYLYKDGRLRSWTEDKAIAPTGINTLADLTGALNLMIKDCDRWEPVEYDALKVGMRLRRRKATTDQPPSSPRRD